VVQQDCNVMAFVNVLAHPLILRRKRRGTYPLAIRKDCRSHLPGAAFSNRYQTKYRVCNQLYSAIYHCQLHWQYYITTWCDWT